MGQFSKSKFQLEIWSVAVAISVRSSDLSAGGVAATTCCKHTARKATITRECQALSLNSPGAMSKWPVVMIGMDSLGPRVKNDQHPFQIPANKKKYRSFGSNCGFQNGYFINMVEYGWIVVLLFDPYATHQLTTHQGSKLNATWPSCGISGSKFASGLRASQWHALRRRMGVNVLELKTHNLWGPTISKYWYAKSGKGTKKVMFNQCQYSTTIDVMKDSEV